MKSYAQVLALLNGLRSADDGAAAVEYGLMLSLIAVVIIAAVAAVGLNLNTAFLFMGGKLGEFAP
ncbi:Flp family type IVb pilin [Cryobacterium frigoriphilum]|uniref:Flp family type IVb pilin n=1 Tax=Cryobacterium frigoriphilum TaxID=1259150 RepID=A0A4R9AAA5_9MICO|nr:Flp family type IVb pilin [Cryobacterium frigoriphilum]TFD55172.1 Flp family type IVb pilin [Cryobacterium frigoriphilum]